MNVEVLQEAESELREAIDHYEKIDPRLGVRLKEEARKVMRWVQANPLLPRLRLKGYRRVNLRGFPYYLPYFIWNDTIWILAFAHGRRRPEYWVQRRKHVR